MVTNSGGGGSRNDRYFIAIQHSRTVAGCRFSSMLWVLHSRGCRLWALNWAAKGGWGGWGGGIRGKILDNDKEENKVGSLGHSSVIRGAGLRVGGSAA